MKDLEKLLNDLENRVIKLETQYSAQEKLLWLIVSGVLLNVIKFVVNN